VVISEFMASNTRTLTDEDGESSDWIEIHNAGSNSVNLLNWALTDKLGDSNPWRFRQRTSTRDGYLIVFASGKDRRVPGAPLHTDFKLSAAGEYLALIEPDESPSPRNSTRSFPRKCRMSPSARRCSAATRPGSQLEHRPRSGAHGGQWGQ